MEECVHVFADGSTCGLEAEDCMHDMAMPVPGTSMHPFKRGLQVMFSPEALDEASRIAIDDPETAAALEAAIAKIMTMTPEQLVAASKRAYRCRVCGHYYEEGETHKCPSE